MAECASTPTPDTYLRILASGSSGNCSVLIHRTAEGKRRVWMIDAGLSPRRTTMLLRAMGVTLADIEGLFLTHLDTDHWCPSWRSALPRNVAVRVHDAHARDFAHLAGETGRALTFDQPISLGDGVEVSPVLAAHDEEGAAVFRFHFPRGSLGFATDIGQATTSLISHLRGVDVLAIESNYCPVMQKASPRPAFLKQRIMGGHGHLSNQQSAAATRAIAPRSHVVLLHLSRQCNLPALAAREHGGAQYRVTIASQHSPTPWVPIAGAPPGEMPVSDRQSLFVTGVGSATSIAPAGTPSP